MTQRLQQNTEISTTDVFTQEWEHGRNIYQTEKLLFKFWKKSLVVKES